LESIFNSIMQKESQTVGGKSWWARFSKKGGSSG
jgi:hypothetical protein